MSHDRIDWRHQIFATGCAGLLCLVSWGCHDEPAVSARSYPEIQKSTDEQPGAESSTDSTDLTSPPARVDANSVQEGSAVSGTAPDATPSAGPGEPVSPNAPESVGTPSHGSTAEPPPVSPENPLPARHFVVEGPGDALRIGFDDLDLLKIINMEPVTSDCVEKMPPWLRALDGKHVRIRGYMKPSGVDSEIPEFVFVRSTDLCCFGPKGKVYHLIAVKLKPKTTTDYIELKPFDVVGKFRIEKVELDDGLIFLLYHIDDAAIIRK
ncbi:MAG: hypothetical protein JSS02_18910 [Planctomycetes bacterium]|nr:hypothetical protein [Planctomycetota bacterium]